MWDVGHLALWDSSYDEVSIDFAELVDPSRQNLFEYGDLHAHQALYLRETHRNECPHITLAGCDIRICGNGDCHRLYR